MKIFAGAVAVIIGIIYFFVMEFGTQHDVTFRIASKDDQSGQSGHTYLIFTGRNHELVNSDAMWHGKHDSSDLWARMHVGDTYTCPVYGYRRYWPTSYMDILDGCKLRPAGTPTTY
jgi:hypothetical protein